MAPQRDERLPRGNTDSSLSGSARDVVQARDVHGGIHYHTTDGAELPIPRQLPADIHDFVGRHSELAQLAALVADSTRPSTPIVLIAGTAGSGKSAAAIHLAYHVLELFPDGQLFVNLRGYDAGAPVAPQAALERFLRALGLPPQAIPVELEERAEIYRSLVAGQRMLIVLDNAATVGQVRPLLPGEPRCAVLITSRARLSGLSARDGAHRLTLGLLPEADATALVAALTSPYRSEDDATQVAELARLCAHLPLALRIAAERAAARPLMPLRDLICDLRNESSLWDALSAEDEADAVRTVFAWSYRALPLPAARAFRLLGIHPGPEFSIGAAAALLDEDLSRTRSLVDLLAGAHLLEQIGPTRYQYHDLLRAYAATQAQLDEEPEQCDAAWQRLADWYMHTAEAAGRTAFPGLAAFDTHKVSADTTRFLAFADYREATEWFLTERANLLAVTRAAAARGLPEIAWRLPAATHFLQQAYQTTDEWLEMSDLALQAAGRLNDRQTEAGAFTMLGDANAAAGRPELAERHHRAALERRVAIGDSLATAWAATNLGLFYSRLRRLDHARTCYEQALTAAQAAGDQFLIGASLCNLAYTELDVGRPGEAVRLADEAEAVYNGIDADPRLRADPPLLRARVYREAREFPVAAAQLEMVRQLIGDLHNPLLDQAVLLEQGALRQNEGNFDAALETYWQAAVIQRSAGDPSRQALLHDRIGRTLRELGRIEEAADFLALAVSGYRHLRDAWHIGEALIHLAKVWEDLGRRGEADAAYREAASLLAEFPDLHSTALREGLEIGGY